MTEAAAPSISARIGGVRASVLLLVILVVAAVVRVAFVLVAKLEPFGDYITYWNMATNLYGGVGLVDEFGNRAFMFPGYPVLISGLFFLTGPSLLAAQLMNCLLGVIAVALIFRIVAEFHGIRAGLIAAALYAVYVEAVVYADYLAKENLMIVLMLAQIAIAGLIARKPARYGASIVLGIALGTQALVGSPGVAVVPLLGWIVWRRVGLGAVLLRHAAIVAAAAAITVVPWLYRNYLIFDSFVLSTNSGFNLYLGNNPRATERMNPIENTPLAAQWETLRATLGEQGATQYAGRLAADYVRAHPAESVAMWLRRALVFWLPPYHEGLNAANQSRAEKLTRLVWLVEWLAIAALALLPLLVRAGRSGFVLAVYATMAIYTAIHLPVYVVFRYRLPMMPLLCILAGIGVAVVAEKLAARYRSKAAVAA